MQIFACQGKHHQMDDMSKNVFFLIVLCCIASYIRILQYLSVFEMVFWSTWSTDLF